MDSISEELSHLLTKNKLHLYKVNFSSVTITIFFEQFLDECVNELVGKGELNLENYKDTDAGKSLKDTKNYIKHFYHTAIIENSYKPDPTLSKEVKECLKTCYDVRKEDIFQALAKESLLKAKHNIVDNFDWKIKWILGSSDLATIKEPVLQIDLHCIYQEKDLIKGNIVNFEANSEKVDQLIDALTKIKMNLESL